jgi:hypothetical protein
VRSIKDIIVMSIKRGIYYKLLTDFNHVDQLYSWTTYARSELVTGAIPNFDK